MLNYFIAIIIIAVVGAVVEVIVMPAQLKYIARIIVGAAVLLVLVLMLMLLMRSA